MDSFIQGHVILREDGQRSSQVVSLVVEEPLEIRINGTSYVVAMRTPGYEKELAVGLCLTEGIVDSFSDITSVDFRTEAGNSDCNIINVTVKFIAGGASGRGIESRSSCGLCGVRMLEDLERNAVPIESDMKVNARIFSG